MNDAATLALACKRLQEGTPGQAACVALLDAVSAQRLSLSHLAGAGLLRPICAALCSNQLAPRQRAVAVLLEASQQGPGGEEALANAPGCPQALLDLAAAGGFADSSVFGSRTVALAQKGSQQTRSGSTAAAVAAVVDSPAEAARAASLIIFRLAATPESQHVLLEATTGLLQVLLGRRHGCLVCCSLCLGLA
jgi:hypothetical protein